MAKKGNARMHELMRLTNGIAVGTINYIENNRLLRAGKHSIPMQIASFTGRDRAIDRADEAEKRAARCQVELDAIKRCMRILFDELGEIGEVNDVVMQLIEKYMRLTDGIEAGTSPSAPKAPRYAVTMQIDLIIGRDKAEDRAEKAEDLAEKLEMELNAVKSALRILLEKLHELGEVDNAVKQLMERLTKNNPEITNHMS